MQFDVTISPDKKAHKVDIFPLREDADIKLAAAGYVKHMGTYPFTTILAPPQSLLKLCHDLDLIVDPTYLEANL